MQSKFLSYISQQHLFAEGGRVLLAVSGGRDSVTLCHLMAAAGYGFDMAHCNFHLRPGDCDRDEAFVRRLASQYGCRVHVAQFSTRTAAQQHGIGIEEQARNERYAYFAQLLHDEHYSCVAVAHHQDDSIETFFLHLLRGTGITGLHGILPFVRRQVMVEANGAAVPFVMPVARPLLCFTRQEIDAYVQEHCLEYVEDYTNSQHECRRNRIRLELMPLLERLSPGFRRTMADNMVRLGEAEELYRQRVDEVRRQVTLPDTPSAAVSFSLEKLRGLQPQRTLLFELLSPYGFTAGMANDVAAILGGSPGRCVVSTTHRLTLERDRLAVVPLASIPDEEEEVPIPLISLSSGDIRVKLPEGGELCAVLAMRASLPQRLCLPRNQACFDYGALRQPLLLRRWHPGDRFRPFGMKGSQLVSDYFSDHGFTRLMRERCWLLADAGGAILWLAGHRAASIAQVTDSSRQVVLLTIPPAL